MCTSYTPLNPCLTCLQGPCVAAPGSYASSSGPRAFQSGFRTLPPASRGVLPASHGRGAATRRWISAPLSPLALPHAHSLRCSAGSAAGRSGPLGMHSVSSGWSFPPKGEDE